MVHYADLAPHEVDGTRTAAVRTVLDCARSLDFDVALSVADSALRHGDVDPGELASAARAARGPGSGRIRRVAGAADGRAANPFESVLRAIALEEGWHVVPQRELLVLRAVLRPDLVEEERRTVLEADSWTWHAGREEHDRDCDRYNLLVAAGWRVLRFTWWQVMREPGYVRAILREIDRPPGRAMGSDTPRSVA